MLNNAKHPGICLKLNAEILRSAQNELSKEHSPTTYWVLPAEPAAARPRLVREEMNQAFTCREGASGVMAASRA